MHGYEPPKHQDEGSWSEIFAITVAVFQTLAIPLLMIGVVLGLAIGAIIALFTNPPLALLPIAALGVIAVLFVRRDKRVREEMERDMNLDGSSDR